MRILLLINKSTGLYNARKELIISLLNEGHSVIAATPFDMFVEDLKELGVSMINVPVDRRGKNPIKDFLLLKRYKKIIGAEKPNLVFTFTIKPNVYGGIVCGKKNIPYVANITGLGTAVENSGFLQKITISLYRKGLKNAQNVFFQNESNKNFMIKKRIVKGKCSLIPGSGVNLNKFSLQEYPRGKKVHFAFIGRVMKEKGIEQYLEAAKWIHERYPDTVFHVCGICDKKYMSIINDLNDEGLIVYHGLVKEMKEIYSMISCTIHPSFYPEGLSNVLLESCASGRPIITTDRSGCKEVVDDGVNGFLIKQKDSIDLQEKIEKFLSLSVDERMKMGQKGREKVEREFDRNIVVRKYLEEVKATGERKNAKNNR